MPNFDTPSIGNLTSLFTYTNDITSGWFGISLVIITFCIAFISMIRWRTENALLSSLFLTMVISSLLFVAGLVPNYVVVYVIIALIAVAIIKFVSD